MFNKNVALLLLLVVTVKSTFVASLDVNNATLVNDVAKGDDDVKEEPTLKDFDVSSGVDNSTNANSRRWAPYPGSSQQPEQPEQPGFTIMKLFFFVTDDR